MNAILILITYVLAVLAPVTGIIPSGTGGSARDEGTCKWFTPNVHPNITSWELQLAVPAERLVSLQQTELALLSAAAKVSRDIEAEMTGGDGSTNGGFLVRKSAWRRSVMQQTQRDLTTKDGLPLWPQVHDGKPYKWLTGHVVVRRREYYAHSQHHVNASTAVTPGLPGADVRGKAGYADLTLKVHGIDLDTPLPISLPPVATVHGITAKSKWKIENDLHCATSKAAFSGTFDPVPHGVNTTTLAGVVPWYSDLPTLFGFSSSDAARLPLPLHNTYNYTKTVWDAQCAGVDAQMSLVVSYASVDNALVGRDGLVGELSLRVKRSSTLDTTAATPESSYVNGIVDEFHHGGGGSGHSKDVSSLMRQRLRHSAREEDTHTMMQRSARSGPRKAKESGMVSQVALQAALEVAGRAAQAFRKRGWDMNEA